MSYVWASIYVHPESTEHQKHIHLFSDWREAKKSLMTYIDEDYTVTGPQGKDCLESSLDGSLTKKLQTLQEGDEWWAQGDECEKYILVKLNIW